MFVDVDEENGKREDMKMGNASENGYIGELRVRATKRRLREIFREREYSFHLRHGRQSHLQSLSSFSSRNS